MFFPSLAESKLYRSIQTKEVKSVAVFYGQKSRNAAFDLERQLMAEGVRPSLSNYGEASLNGSEAVVFVCKGDWDDASIALLCQAFAAKIPSFCYSAEPACLSESAFVGCFQRLGLEVIAAS